MESWIGAFIHLFVCDGMSGVGLVDMNGRGNKWGTIQQGGGPVWLSFGMKKDTVAKEQKKKQQAVEGVQSCTGGSWICCLDKTVQRY